MTDPSKPISETNEAGKSECLDEDGLPLDRAPTLDDVRGNAGSGRSIAVGCSLAVTLFAVAFWLVRFVLMR